MRNCFYSSTPGRSAYPKSAKWAILAAAFVLMVLAPVTPCRGQDEKASEIMEAASANIEKYRKGNAAICFNTTSGKPVKAVSYTHLTLPTN